MITSDSSAILAKDGSISLTPSNGIVTANGEMHATGDVISGYGSGGQVSGLHHMHPTAEPGAPSMPTPDT